MLDPALSEPSSVFGLHERNGSLLSPEQRHGHTIQRALCFSSFSFSSIPILGEKKVYIRMIHIVNVSIRTTELFVLLKAVAAAAAWLDACDVH